MKKKKKGLFTNKRLGLAAILVLLVASIAAVFSPEVRNILTYRKNLKAAGTVPAHHKTVKPNGDGTYKISLDVTGDAETVVQKSNIIVIMDTSNSMNENTPNSSRSEYTYDANTYSAGNKYFNASSNGSQVYYVNGQWRTSQNANQGSQYTGTVWYQPTRISDERVAMESLVTQLLSNNDSSSTVLNDVIEISIVSFNLRASTLISNSNNAASLHNTIYTAETKQGTNWEEGLQEAIAEANRLKTAEPNDSIYFIFLTDGEPTAKKDSTGYDNQHWANWNAAKDEARSAAQINSTTEPDGLYTIFTYGSNQTYINYLDNLTHYAYGVRNYTNSTFDDKYDRNEHFYDASDTTALIAAFREISNDISSKGIGTAKIVDGTTESVTTSTGPMNLLTVDNKFDYYISFPIKENNKVMLNNITATLSGSDDNATITWSETKTLTGKIEDGKFVYHWTAANDLYNFAPPAATNENSEVKWDLSACGVLINEATYTVSFDVWPSQTTYDLIADLQNGAKTYSELDENVKKYLSEDYVLKTNTGATLTYTDTRVPSTTTVDYEDPGNAPLETSQITVEKTWIDGATTIDDPKDEEGKPFELTMKLIRDDTVTNNEITVSKALNNWKAKKYIATGLMRTHATDANSGTLEVLDTGHDYRLQEPAAISYHWELTVETTHPMIIDGTLTTLIEVKGNDIPATVTSAENNTYLTVEGKKYFKFNNKVYKIKDNSNAELSAYNNRKSYLEFKKMVTGDAPEGKEFNFSFTINNVINKALETKDDIWFSVYDTVKGETVMDIETNATKEIKEGKETGYYTAPNKTTITVKLQHGWNLRVINLGTTSTYTINEVGIATENTTAALDASDPQYFMIKDIAVTTTLPDEEAAEYDPTIGDTSVSGTISKVNTGYSVVFTNDYPGTYLTVNKEWVGEAQDSVEVELYQTIAGETTNVKDKDGENVKATLSEENEWTYTFEGLALRTQEETPRPITYSVKEVEIDGYKTTYTQDSNDTHIWTITNEELTEATVIKTWDDADNQDGKRPTTLTVKLLADGVETGKSVDLDITKKTDEKGNIWSETITDLDKFNADGSEIAYTWEEVLDSSYYTKTSQVKSGTTTTITNKHEPIVINLQVVKSWNDTNNQDGYRPESIVVHLLANGTEVDHATLRGDSWTYTFSNKPKYANQTEITYTVTETLDEEGNPLPSQYTLTDNSRVEDTITLTNTHTTEKTSICVKKAWVDDNNRDGLRKLVVVELLKNGVGTKQEYTLSADNQWTVTINELDKFASGQLIQYAFQEITQLQDYSVTYSNGEELGINEGTITVTNTHEPYKTNISGAKTWNDANNQDGYRPPKITINLLKTVNGTTSVADTREIPVADTISFSFENLPLYENEGQAISYDIEEVEVENYTAHITKTNGENGPVYTIENEHKPEKTEATVKKVWTDNNDQDGYRPTSLTVKLLADGADTGKSVTLTANNSWTDTITGLDKKANGKDIAYTWDEGTIDKYTPQEPVVEETVTTIENVHEIEKTEATVKKVWTDNDDQDGYRPTSLTVKLLADGADTGKSVTLDKDNSWTDTIKGLDKKAKGKDIVYSWDEGTVANYTMKDPKVEGTVITIENVHETEKTQASVKKVWTDKNDQDGYRPKSLTVKLLADGNDTGKSVTLTADNNWTDKITELDTKKDGKVIVYSWDEGTVDKYTAKDPVVEGTVTTIENVHEIEKTEATVKKVWTDNNDQDGYRPTSLTVKLLAGGEDTGKSVTLNKDNSWTAKITGLDKKASGKDIVYSWDEGTVDKYTAKDPVVEGTVVTIENVHETEKTQASVKKVWTDNNDQDGKRPTSLTVKLLADGADTGKSVTLKADNNWTDKITELDTKKDGKDIVYSWDEGTISDYTAKDPVVEGTVTTLENVHTPELINLEVVKTWSDNDNQDGKRPTEITINLLANGEVDETVTIKEVNKEWKHTFTNKPKYANGSAIDYTVTEKAVDEYTPTYDGLTITNTHTIAKTSICVTKDWVDNDNQDGYRPETVIINVLATTTDGTRIADTHTLNGTDDNWTYTFENLDVYDKGLPIEYTIEEANVDSHYVAKVEGSVEDGYTVTNTHETDKTEISVEKVWDDADNQDGKRADVVVTLIADNKPTEKTVTLTEANGYKAKFEKLEKYRDKGTEIIYTVDELEKNVPEGYTKTSVTGSMAEGFKITNTHEPEKTEVSGEKIWDNEANIYGFATPQSITVILKVEDEVVATQTVSADEDGNWKYSFTGLDKYKAGEVITYTVDEEPIVDYDTHIDQKTRMITNKYNPEFAVIKGTKKWIDEDNQDGIRPSSITIDLVGKVGETEVYREERTIEGNVESDTWTYTIEDLPKYANGEEITWYAEETKVEGYEKQETVLDIVNTHTPEKVSYTVYKEWDDNDNQDGKRPGTITIRLYDDLGNEVRTLELNEENEWTGTFTELPKFREHGTPIKYSIKEDAVEEYEKPEIEEIDDYSSVVTNQHIIEKINIHIVKNWVDDNNKHGYRPEFILVDIYANENLYDTIELNEENNWEALIEELDKYSEGEEIIYTVREQPVENYIVSYNNYNIFNELDPGLEIIPPDTRVGNEAKNVGILYFIVAIIGMLAGIYKKVYE